MLTRKKVVTGAAVVVAAFLAGVCIVTSTATSGFTASVNDATNTIGSGTSLITATNGGTTNCTSVPNGTIPSTSAFTCAGNKFPAVAATGTTTSSTTLANSGTAPFTSATYRANSCAPIQLANATSATDPMLVRGNVTFAQTGPLAGSTALGTNGTNALAVDVVSRAGTSTLSVGVWFKSTTASGTLIGFSTSANEVIPTNNYDRSLYFDSTGHIVFGVYPGVYQTVKSVKAYNDGQWHYAVGTFAGSTIISSRATLYVDGVSVGSNSTLTLGLGTMNYTGYWRVGQSGMNTSWGGAGNYFTGSLTNAAVFSTELSATQVAALYSPTTQTAYSSALSTAAPILSWTLGDNGLQTFGGAYPVLGTTSPCAGVRVTVGTATKCIYPASSSPCVAATSINTIPALVASNALALDPSTAGSAQTVTVTLSRDTTYNTGYDVGLNILVPITIVENGFTQTFNWTSNRSII